MLVRATFLARLSHPKLEGRARSELREAECCTGVPNAVLGAADGAAVLTESRATYERGIGAEPGGRSRAGLVAGG